MGLATDEQEIHISKLRNEDKFLIYISDRTYKTKIERAGVKPYKVDLDENKEEIAWYYELPKNQISFRKPPKKRALTEEQKEKARIRMENARNQSRNENLEVE